MFDSDWLIYIYSFFILIAFKLCTQDRLDQCVSKGFLVENKTTIVCGVILEK